MKNNGGSPLAATFSPYHEVCLRNRRHAAPGKLQQEGRHTANKPSGQRNFFDAIGVNKWFVYCKHNPWCKPQSNGPASV